jgi:hypothetical protein
VWVFID